MEIKDENLSIASIIAILKKLKKHASDKYREIEDFYRYTDSGHVFNSPMNVPAGNMGGNNRGNMSLQNNAYVVAKNYYYAFLLDEKPTELLEKLLSMHQEEKLVSETKLEEVGIGAPLADRFYLDFEHFMQEIEELQKNLKKVTMDKALWTDYFSTIFKEQSLKLIKDDKLRPSSFAEALASIQKELSPSTDVLEIDIDYFFGLSRIVYATTISLSHSLKDGSLVKSHSNIVSELKTYLKKLQYPEIIELFEQVFKETYYDEVEYKDACQRALKTTEGEEPRWTVEQLRKPVKKEEAKQGENKQNSNNASDSFTP